MRHVDPNDRPPPRRSAGLALVGAVLAAVGAVLAGSILIEDREVSIGQNIRINEPAPIDANNSPAVARHPRDPSRLALVHRVDRPAFSARLQLSDDGGRSWRAAELPLPEGKDRPFAADVAFGSDGTLYVLYANLSGPGNVPDNLWLLASADGGRSLPEPRRVTGRFAFQPRLAVHPDGALHVTWLQADEVGLLRLVGRAPIVTARSDDEGRSWSTPVEVSDAARERVGAASPIIDATGRLVVMYQDFRGDRRDFENLEGPPWDEPFSLVVTWSVDGGRTFAPEVELDAGIVPTRRFLVFLPEFPSIASGGQPGQLYAVWADGRNGDEDVFLRSSSDGGRTWTAPARVNDNPLGDGTSQYLPAVDVAEDGRVDVLYLDRRRDPADQRADATLASSYDAGRSFSTLRLSSASFDTTVGSAAAPHLPVDFGTRLALESTDGELFAAWTDTRFGDAASGRQDVIGAAVRFPDRDGMVWRAAVAAVLLLAASGVLGSWWRRRRR